MAEPVYLQPGFILQHRAYRESSLLLDVFTRDHGVIPLLAKGVRKEKSRMAGLLLPFTLINLSYLDRHDLKTLTQVEHVRSFDLQRLALYCGFYVNELLQIFLHKYDPHPQLFVYYQTCLTKLADNVAVEEALRHFELHLLQESGYGVQLDMDCHNQLEIQPHLRYQYQAGNGMVADPKGLVSGQTLMLLDKQATLDVKALQEAKLLMRKMLDSHLQGRLLKSRDVLAAIIKHL
jgi:DNA repair protein RecO (recombination protein O)